MAMNVVSILLRCDSLGDIAAHVKGDVDSSTSSASDYVTTWIRLGEVERRKGRCECRNKLKNLLKLESRFLWRLILTLDGKLDLWRLREMTIFFQPKLNMWSLPILTT